MAKIFTEKQREFIKKHAKGITSNKLTELVNAEFGTAFTKEQIRNFKSNNKIHSGLDTKIGQFKAGQTPWNKGKKWTPELREKIINSKTSSLFRKGHRPMTELPLYSERVNRDGMVEIKVNVADYPQNTFKKNSYGNGWIMKHHKVWIDFYKKPIPKGHKVIFIDQNKQNFDIKNLKLVTNSLMARLNQNHRLTSDPTLSSCGIMVEEIKMKLRGKNNARF